MKFQNQLENFQRRSQTLEIRFQINEKKNEKRINKTKQQVIETPKYSEINKYIGNECVSHKHYAIESIRSRCITQTKMDATQVNDSYLKPQARKSKRSEKKIKRKKKEGIKKTH